MFAAFPAERRAELDALAARFGAPLVRIADLSGDAFDPVDRLDGRVGEVCFVIRRPNGRLLTAIKTIYPPGAYRLLTGGIGEGEGILDALLRETREETALDVVVRRFLAAVAYRRSEALAFATFAFLLDEAGGTLASGDPDEQIAEFREIAVADLDAMAAFLEALPARRDARVRGSWRDWGRFRAVIHRAVGEALRGRAD